MDSKLIFTVITCWLSSAQLTPPTDGTLALVYDANFTGKGSRNIGQFNCADNWGGVTLDQRSWQSVNYQHQYGWGDDLMNMFSVSSDGELAIVWVYCNGANAHYAFSQDYSHYNTGEQASGVCAFNANKRTNVHVTFPSIMSAPRTAPPNNVYVHGETIEIRNNLGWVVLDDGNYTVITWTTIDCTTCGDPGWMELHGFLINSEKKKICFTIFYLQLQNTRTVPMEYTLCLSDLTTPFKNIPATWTGNLTSTATATPPNDRDSLETKMYRLRHDAVV